jgi:hypothetical protein
MSDRERNLDLLASEERIDAMAEAVIMFAHERIWIDGRFNATEARLCWMTVIKKMVESAWIDRKNDMVKEHKERSK